jgi:hypothetical protein
MSLVHGANEYVVLGRVAVEGNDGAIERVVGPVARKDYSGFWGA